MSRKYSEKPVNVTVEAEESQLDRVERKVDRILHILESGELPTLQLDGKKIAENIARMSAYDRFKIR